MLLDDFDYILHLTHKPWCEPGSLRGESQPENGLFPRGAKFYILDDKFRYFSLKGAFEDRYRLGCPILANVADRDLYAVTEGFRQLSVAIILVCACRRPECQL